jgi:excisionase family DNA binding protein
MTVDEARHLPTVVTVAQAAELLGVSRRRCYELVETGVVPVLRYGRALRVPSARLLDLLGIQPWGDRNGGP